MEDTLVWMQDVQAVWHDSALEPVACRQLLIYGLIGCSWHGTRAAKYSVVKEFVVTLISSFL